MLHVRLLKSSATKIPRQYENIEGLGNKEREIDIWNLQSRSEVVTYKKLMCRQNEEWLRTVLIESY